MGKAYVKRTHIVRRIYIALKISNSSINITYNFRWSSYKNSKSFPFRITGSSHWYPPRKMGHNLRHCSTRNCSDSLEPFPTDSGYIDRHDWMKGSRFPNRWSTERMGWVCTSSRGCRRGPSYRSPTRVRIGSWTSICHRRSGHNYGNGGADGWQWTGLNSRCIGRTQRRGSNGRLKIWL